MTLSLVDCCVVSFLEEGAFLELFQPLLDDAPLVDPFACFLDEGALLEPVVWCLDDSGCVDGSPWDWQWTTFLCCFSKDT